MVLKNQIDKAKFLALKTSKLNLPVSLLIIPDGNGRWAKNLGLEISKGHQAGGKTISEVLLHFMNVNIKYLGIWGFSEDNWKRSKKEIDKIMEVMEEVIKQNLKIINDNGIKFVVLGEIDKIRDNYPSLYKVIENAQKLTITNTNKALILFVSYGERYQLEEFAKFRQIDKTISAYDIISKINAGIPLFDMVLRTSGEMRLSGFGPLASLAEFISVKKNLPDLTDMDILKALKEYSGRQRRFGGR